MSIVIRALAFLGLIAFSALLALSFVSPEKIEFSAKGFIKNKIEEEVQNKYEKAQDADITEQFSAFAERWGLEQEKFWEDLGNQLPQVISETLNSLCDYECEEKKALTTSIAEGYLERLKALSTNDNVFTDLIKRKYSAILTKLSRELRLFLGINILVFLLIFLASLIKTENKVQLGLSLSLLYFSIATCCGIYLYNSNWFYRILYNDPIGYWYLSYVAIILLLLVDAVFNRSRVNARITHRIS